MLTKNGRSFTSQANLLSSCVMRLTTKANGGEPEPVYRVYWTVDWDSVGIIHHAAIQIVEHEYYSFESPA